MGSFLENHFLTVQSIFHIRRFYFLRFACPVAYGASYDLDAPPENWIRGVTLSL
jgi:hypothetical protein